MQPWLITLVALWCSLVVSRMAKGAEPAGNVAARMFEAQGVVLEVQPDAGKVTIQHEAVSNYMEAMTMTFKVKTPVEITQVHRGDRVHFKLHVTEDESWVDQIIKTGEMALAEKAGGDTLSYNTAPTEAGQKAALAYHFTNELGQVVSLGSFRGQAVALTFFYTRCPLPDYCPRLSKNFQEAQQKLKALSGAPTNWHFLSLSFDTDFDSPAMLKAYGEFYHYDPEHWSFLTGPKAEVAQLARECGSEYTLEDGTYDHNFRTLIIDAAGRLQMIFPTGGDLSDAIVAEIIKATAATNAAVQPAITPLATP